MACIFGVQRSVLAEVAAVGIDAGGFVMLEHGGRGVGSSRMAHTDGDRGAGGKGLPTSSLTGSSSPLILLNICSSASFR
jgi:hypothetical protein